MKEQITILWADDHWAEDKEKTVLEKIRSRLELTVSLAKQEISWIFTSSLEKTSLDLLKTQGQKIDLIILDYHFDNPDAESDFETICSAISARGIYFMILSGVVDSISTLPESPSFLGVFSKNEDQERMVQRVTGFLSYRPFRMLFLSDLHFNSNSDDEVGEIQNKLYEGLIDQIGKINEEREIDFLIISGDFANKNPSIELDSQELIYQVRDLVKASIGNSQYDRLLIVPGNHDVTWKDFGNSEIDDSPWQKYLNFYSKVYSIDNTPLSELGAWDKTNGLFNSSTIDPSDLCWQRKFSDFNLNILGVTSPSTDPEEKGKGKFHDEVRKFIKQSWKEPSKKGEIRLAIMHHNLFEAISIHPHDEKSKIARSGDAYLTLAKGGCNVLFNGHTHNPNIVKVDGSYLARGVYKKPGSLLVINGGTVGGVQPSLGEPRTFNVVDFMDWEYSSNTRKVSIIPYSLESADFSWEKGENYEIKLEFEP